MKEFGQVTEPITRNNVCTSMRCDMCGCVSDMPKDECFKFATTGVFHAELKSVWHMDGDSDYKSVDLCDVCADKLFDIVKKNSHAKGEKP